MANTKLGGAKSARTNKRKYGPNYYARIGQLGGKAGRTGGFYYMKMNAPDKLKQISSAAARLQKRGLAREES